MLAATVYEKGAEIIRIYQTLLGKAGFRCCSLLSVVTCMHCAATVYRKGAEIIRIYYTLLGKAGFRCLAADTTLVH